jgi:hypothetical protein
LALYDILFSNNPNSQNGYGLVRRGMGEFFRINPNERFYVPEGLSTEIVAGSLIPGYIVKQLEGDENAQYRSVTELLNDSQRNPLGLDMQSLAWGIQEKTKFLVVGTSLDKVMIPRNIEGNLGSAFVLVPASNGKMVPSYLKPLFYNEIGEFILVLSDDCLVLFKQFETNKNLGKVVFWASLFALTDLQINKDKKVVRMNFYSDEKEQQQLRMKMVNVLFFRETLVKKMTNLKVTIEANKLIKGQSIERRLTANDIKHMDIKQLEYYISLFKKKIESDDINLYIINTFSILSGKAVEYYSKNDDSRQKELLIQMQEILKREDIQKILKSNEVVI